METKANRIKNMLRRVKGAGIYTYLRVLQRCVGLVNMAPNKLPGKGLDFDTRKAHSNIGGCPCPNWEQRCFTTV